MRVAVLCVVLVTQACTARGLPWAPTARTSPTSCSATGQPPSQPWRLVSATGFTFCVPAAWRSPEGQTWQGPGAAITWATGEPPRHPVAFGEVITRVPPGQSGLALQHGMAISSTGLACWPARYTESIDGRRAELRDFDCGDSRETGAEWRSPAIFFLGEAQDPAAAAVELQLYRTVRFVTDAAH